MLEQNPEVRPILELVSGVRPESMQAVFDAIDRRYACMEDFFAAEYGMGPAAAAAAAGPVPGIRPGVPGRK